MNAYIIILALFTAAGLLICVWGGIVIAQARSRLRWPQTDGVIVRSVPASGADDLLPEIVFSYTVSGAHYQIPMAFPRDINPTPEFAAEYSKRFPVGGSVRVFYDPRRPERGTLEPGSGRGDWMVFAFGVAMTVLGALMLVFGG